jgi:hypothetical protein
MENESSVLHPLRCFSKITRDASDEAHQIRPLKRLDADRANSTQYHTRLHLRMIGATRTGLITTWDK